MLASNELRESCKKKMEQIKQLWLFENIYDKEDNENETKKRIRYEENDDSSYNYNNTNNNNNITTLTTTTTTSTPSPKIRKKRNILANISNFVIKNNIVVPADYVNHISTTVCDLLRQNESKGKRCRRAHTFNIIKTPITCEKQYVVANTNTEPQCIMCWKTIKTGEDRCKFSVVNSDRLNLPKVELCNTHVYHLNCFVYYMSTVNPGKEAVCFGTCLLRKGGCRKPNGTTKRKKKRQKNNTATTTTTTTNTSSSSSSSDGEEDEDEDDDEDSDSDDSEDSDVSSQN
jgi:hypothetical protein